MGDELGGSFKVLLIGNSSVGKSSLLLRFTEDDFLPDEETTATIGVDFKVAYIEMNGRRYKLSIWDTAGQERFRTLTSSYYRGAQAVLLVYDITSRVTFDELIKWSREIDTYCPDGVVRIILGNKLDKELYRQISPQEGKDFAARMNAVFMECSAKTNIGVIDAFQELVVQMLKRNGGDKPAPPPPASRPVDLFGDDGDAQEENVGCIC